jgi:flavorubredoxin
MQEPTGSIAPIARDIYRISIAIPPGPMPGGFSFNQYLLVDEQPLLFHTGPRKLFPLVKAQIQTVLPVHELRYLAFSHVEADECGALPDFLAAAPNAVPVCGRVGADVSISDLVDVPPLGMEDGQVLVTGTHRLVWQSTPHLPHGWECGYLFDESTRTLFCGDLFTQPGTGGEPLVRHDILEASEAFRRQDDYFSHTRNAGPLVEKLARLEPAVLACMHGSAWTGDGAKMLRALGAALTFQG